MDTATALATLGLTAADGRSDWLREYRRLSRFWNPAENRSAEAPARFREVREAYTYLIDTPSLGDIGDGGGAGPTGPQGPPGQTGNPGIVVSATPPTNPAINDLWLQI